MSSYKEEIKVIKNHIGIGRCFPKVDLLLSGKELVLSEVSGIIKGTVLYRAKKRK